MTAISMEERLTAVEEQLAQLNRQFAAPSLPAELPWWVKIAGTFSNSEDYDEAMRLGREYRESPRPNESEQALNPYATVCAAARPREEGR